MQLFFTLESREPPFRDSRELLNFVLSKIKEGVSVCTGTPSLLDYNIG